MLINTKNEQAAMPTIQPTQPTDTHLHKRHVSIAHWIVQKENANFGSGKFATGSLLFLYLRKISLVMWLRQATIDRPLWVGWLVMMMDGADDDGDSVVAMIRENDLMIM